jgi:biotin synthase
METLDTILALSDEELFARAGAASADRPKAYWYPVPVHGGCSTNPPCRHCKWESFKNDRPGFSDKKSLDEVLRMAEAGLGDGATHLLVPSGWMGYEIPDYFCDYIHAVKSRFDAEVYGLFGAISEASLRNLINAGMDGYQCGLESPDEAVYRKFRPGGDALSDRIETLVTAKKLGLKTWSGFLLAFGLTEAAALAGIEYLKDLGVDWLAIQPFVPYPHTAMQAEEPTNPYRWARLTAAARLYMNVGVNIVATENSGAYENFMALTGANAFFIFPRFKKQA